MFEVGFARAIAYSKSKSFSSAVEVSVVCFSAQWKIDRSQNPKILVSSTELQRPLLHFVVTAILLVFCLHLVENEVCHLHDTRSIFSLEFFVLEKGPHKFERSFCMSLSVFFTYVTFSWNQCKYYFIQRTLKMWLTRSGSEASLFSWTEKVVVSEIILFPRSVTVFADFSIVRRCQRSTYSVFESSQIRTHSNSELIAESFPSSLAVFLFHERRARLL